MIDKINEVRDQLNKQLELKSTSCKEILKISQKLDELINEYYMNEMNRKINDV